VNQQMIQEEELMHTEQEGINQCGIVDIFKTYKLKQKEAARREMEEVEPKTRKGKGVRKVQDIRTFTEGAF